jgi:hypothetical protein
MGTKLKLPRTPCCPQQFFKKTTVMMDYAHQLYCHITLIDVCMFSCGRY